MVEETGTVVQNIEQ